LRRTWTGDHDRRGFVAAGIPLQEHETQNGFPEQGQDQALRCSMDHGLLECKYVAMLRFDGSLFFANSSYLEDQVADIMLKKRR
jgi:MFS superfamily sulfate permease-like transporter